MILESNLSKYILRLRAGNAEYHLLGLHLVEDLIALECLGQWKNLVEHESSGQLA